MTTAKQNDKAKAEADVKADEEVKADDTAKADDAAKAEEVKVEGPRTSDSDDPQRSWTVQDTDDDGVVVAHTPLEHNPGQVFTKDELPDKDRLRAAGINADQYLAALPVED